MSERTDIFLKIETTPAGNYKRVIEERHKMYTQLYEQYIGVVAELSEKMLNNSPLKKEIIILKKRGKSLVQLLSDLADTSHHMAYMDTSRNERREK